MAKALATLLVLGAGLLAAPAGAAIQVKAANGPVLVRFAALHCEVSKAKGFTATGRAAGWRLTVRIYSFAGYRRYPIEYGSEGPADFFATRGDTTYSNIPKPDTGVEGGPELTLGGAVAFPAGRRTLGIGFPLAYRALDFTSQASLAGRAPCRYGR